LFVTHATEVSGAEVMLARYLERSSHRHHVLTLASGPCAAYFEDAGAKVTRLPVLDRVAGVSRRSGAGDAVRSGSHAVAALPRMRRALAAIPEPVVVTNSMKAHVLVPPVARLERRSTGIRLHDMLSRETAGRPARLALREAARFAAATSVVSGAAAEAARTVGIRRPEVIYNGVPIAPVEVTPRNPGPSRVLIVSQIARWKGIDVALAAVEQAVAHGVDCTLDIAGAALFGDASYERDLRARTQEGVLAGRVMWHGRVPEPADLYKRADLLLHLPVEPEPFGLVVCEANVWQVPAVASRIGALPELVDDGRSGVLVAPADSAAAATAITSLLKDEKKRRDMGAAARERVVARFSVDAHVEAFDAWLDRLAGTSTPAANGLTRQAGDRTISR
jgi:glycosyltransferase involved in cell wall biosynthesis